MYSHPYILKNLYAGRRLSKTIYGNRTTTDYSYDKKGRVAQIKHTTENNTNLLILQYLYDGSGNIRIKNNIEIIILLLKNIITTLRIG